MTSRSISDVEAILNFLTGGFSLLGCIWVFHFYSKTLRPRPVSLKLILWLSLSDLIYSISNLLAPFDQKSEELCTIEGLLRLGSTIMGLFWATCIAYSSHQRLSKGEGFQQELFFRIALVLGAVIPAVFAFGPLFSNEVGYGLVAFGCFIKPIVPATQFETALIQMVFFGFPVLISLVLTLVLYFLIAKRMQEFADILPEGQQVNVQRLFWYPAVIFIAYITAVVDNLLQIYNITSSDSYIFTIIHILLTHTVGITNALVYGFHRKKNYETHEKPQVQMMQDPKRQPFFQEEGLDKTMSECDKSVSDLSQEETMPNSSSINKAT